MRSGMHSWMGWTALVGLGVCASVAAAAEPSAEEIARAALERNSSAYANLKAVITMTVTTAKGEKKVRDLEIRSLKTAEGLLRTIVRFRSPEDVAGTAFLVLQNSAGPPDQYLYLPNFKKTRKVPAAQATQSFMGSDFTFLDLGPMPLTDTEVKPSFAKLPDGEVDGAPVYVVEVRPNLKGAPYSRLLVHVDKTLLFPRRVEYFDNVGAALKTLSVQGIKQVKGADGTRVVPGRSEMRNLQKGSSTVLEVTDVDLQSRLDPAEFAPGALDLAPAAAH